MKRFLQRMMILCMVVLCCGCAGQKNTGGGLEPMRRVDTAMGTIVSQTIYGEIGAEDVPDEVLEQITDMEQQLLSWRLPTSELYRINEMAGASTGIALSGEMNDILEQCLKVSRESEGAFDITIGEIVRLWDIDTRAGQEVSGYEIPGEKELVAGLANTGYEKLTIQESTLYLPEGMQLDLGAVGKGLALDRIREYLEERDEIAGAVISVGGSVLTYGEKADGKPWRVGIVNPADTSANIGYLELTGQWCISTSGDYERYVEVNGVRYHHIIDPHTGYPGDSGLGGVTILSENGLLSDALSTACFILGQEKGTELAERFGAEALFVDHNGNISMTDGMKQYFR